jgi:hypothetical protein
VLKTYAHISLTPPKRVFGGKFLAFCARKFEDKIRKKHVFSAKIIPFLKILEELKSKIKLAPIYFG